MTPTRRPKRALGERPGKKRTRSVSINGSALPAPVLALRRDALWELAKAYTYKDGSGEVKVPAGFVTDLASVPRAFWWLIAPMELSAVAPIIHDYLYQTGGDGGRYSRKSADQMFLTIMARESVPVWRRLSAYVAVRWFASGAWKG